MIYRFAKPDSHDFSAYGGTLRDIKARIESWFAPGSVVYHLDECGEGCVAVAGKRVGYVDLGPVES